MRRLQITLPLPPNRANPKSKGHWAPGARAKKVWVEGVTHLINRAVRVSGVPVPFERVRVRVRMVVYNPYDDDNVTALLKWPLDALKKAGVIVDDRRPYLRLDGIPEQEICRRRPTGWPTHHLELNLYDE